MNQFTIDSLELTKIIEEIKPHALSAKAQYMLDNLKPITDMDRITSWMNETTEAKLLLIGNSSVPLTAMEGIQSTITQAQKSIVLNPQELSNCHDMLEAVQRLKKYMDSMRYTAPHLTSYASSMFELKDLREEIGRCIINGRVDDRASSELARIRKKLLNVGDKIRQKLNEILRSATYTDMLQDAVISTRNGRYVVPVKRKYQKTFPGQVLDLSATGSTVFMEPSVISRLQEEVSVLNMEEINEVNRVLAYLSGSVAEHSRELSINMETMAHYDFVFAKAKYSLSMEMNPVILNNRGHINIKQARHPLLGKNAIPLDLDIGDSYSALVITGPNTGGKTVVLKTIGLLTLMVQCGLHVPVATGSEFAVFTNILVDIGDGQSIEQSLSTFSSHVKNILTIVKYSNPNTLVIMDELGAGTDPAEGRGFAIAILEEIFANGATIVATTHFGEIKEFALQTDGFENGCMAFDIETLSPLYKLKIGTWGESNALNIALRLGIDPRIIERAYEVTYGYKPDSPVYKEYKPDNLLDQDELNITRNNLQVIEASQRQKSKLQRSQQHVKKDLKLGDCVFISTMQRTGIVCEEENSRGDLQVMVMGKKYVVNNKRLSLQVDRKDLYPDNYDMDIVFETKENRKKRKIMSKRHVDGLVIENDPHREDL